MQDLNEEPIGAVFRILRFLNSSPGKELMFRKYNNMNIDGYMDTDCAGSTNDKKSTSGYYTFVSGNLVT